MIRHARLYELLTGQPADPEAQVKAAIAVARIKHATRIHLRSAHKAIKCGQLMGAR